MLILSCKNGFKHHSNKKQNDNWKKWGPKCQNLKLWKPNSKINIEAWEIIVEMLDFWGQKNNNVGTEATRGDFFSKIPS